MPLFDIFAGRDVLVTGHTGFKGAWLSLWLAELGARVHGFALAPPTTPSLFDEAAVRDRLASCQIADVRDHSAVLRAVTSIKPEFVFHLAAQSLVRRSYHDPRETYETNVMGTVNLLEAVRQSSTVRVCQIITSDKCYENREWVYPYRENEPMGGADPYSNSKGCAELVTAAYRHSYFAPERIASHGVSLASARAGNVIGGGDWAEDRIVPDCIRALSEGNPIQVRHPQAIRPWQHVLEPLSGYLQLAARQWKNPADAAEAWNFGPAGAGHLTVREVVEIVIRHWGKGTWNVPTEAASSSVKGSGSFHEAKFLKLDISKAMSMLPWEPLFDASTAIATTVEWYRERGESGGQFDAQQKCLAQIRAYTARAAHRGVAWASQDAPRST